MARTPKPMFETHDTLRLARTWRLPDGPVCEGSAVIVLGVCPIRGQAPRYSVRVIDTSSPRFDFQGFINEDMLTR